MDSTFEHEQERLDKWLWAARFFKTRQLAVEAITGGKVHLNGQRAKPGKPVRIGSRLQIHKGPYEWDIEITRISKQRRPAVEARELYVESVDSIQRREKVGQEQRLLRLSQNQPGGGKPSKRNRRMIQRFTGKD